MEKEQQKLDEIRNYMERLEDRIEKLEKEKPEEVRVSRIERFEDIKHYPLLKVDKLYGGLPIYDTSTTTNHLQGEIYLTKIGSTTTIHAFVDGAEVDL